MLLSYYLRFSLRNYKYKLYIYCFYLLTRETWLPEEQVTPFSILTIQNSSQSAGSVRAHLSMDQGPEWKAFDQWLNTSSLADIGLESFGLLVAFVNVDLDHPLACKQEEIESDHSLICLFLFLRCVCYFRMLAIQQICKYLIIYCN